ncbi:integrase core domain protein [Teladorsagia circumcincta]|uniref:RNA-directed DNA polymerase n=1 Tax=Teladorsagia circumcincta TaxID=45464 RepID=A0A2G9UYN3_TELCI|nr:integrase core domain protein [Teladorsagia circumcincta]
MAVGYFSKALSDSKRRWSPTHIELFAMISALRFFRATIYGNLTRIFSDHKPLTFLLKHNKVHDNLARWIVELQSYNITIDYLRGSSNTVADCLSRIYHPSSRFDDNSPETDDIVEPPRCLSGLPWPQPEHPPLLQYSPIAIRPHDLLIEQQQDPFCKSLLGFLRHGVFKEDVPDDRKPSLIQIAANCLVKANGCLYYRKTAPSAPGLRHDLVVVPERLKEPLFLAFHDSPSAGGHFFWRKTLAKLSRRYFWPHMAEDVYALCRSCDVCQRKKAAARNREDLLLPVPVAIFDKVYVDLTSPMHTTEMGNRYIMAIIDHFSKYVVAVAIPDCSSTTVARALMNECILKYGVMSELISDNASYLRSETLIELGKLLRINRYFCTPYHHEGNGACERVFATFQLMLRSYISTAQMDWDQFVPACAFMYNTSAHGSTQNTPFFLMFGRDPSFNVDLIIRHHEERHLPSGFPTHIYIERLLPVLHCAWQCAYQVNMKQREKYKAQYDKTHLPPLEVSVGDRVYLKNFTPSAGLSAKLRMPWLGQFRVISVQHPHVVIVSISSPGSPPKKVHMNQVKKCHLLSGPVFTTPWLPEEEQAALVNCQAQDYFGVYAFMSHPQGRGKADTRPSL